MSSLQNRATRVGLACASYGLFRHVLLPNDASKLLSSALYGLTADHVDIEIVTPFLVAPSVMNMLSRIKSDHFTKGLYSLSVGYIGLEFLHSTKCVPRNLRKFFEYNFGVPLEIQTRFKTEFANNGWVTRECSESYSVKQMTKESIMRTMISIGKFQVLTAMVRMWKTRSLSIDLRRNVVEWARTGMFCWIILFLTGQFPTQYNKAIQYFNDSEKLEDYRPSIAFQIAVMSVFAYFGLHFQSKSKHKMLASYLFIQAVITRMNKRDMKIKPFLPMICYLFCQF